MSFWAPDNRICFHLHFLIIQSYVHSEALSSSFWMIFSKIDPNRITEVLKKEGTQVILSIDKYARYQVSGIS